MAFKSLPLEKLNEHIACFIEDDKDLCTFTLVCRDTYNAVHAYRHWRTRFASRYDLDPGKSASNLGAAYITRRMALQLGGRRGAFQQAKTKSERACLSVLRELIVESFMSSSGAAMESKNIAQLHRFARASNLLDTMMLDVHKSNESGRLMQTIQIILTHLHLDLTIRSPSQGFCWSQQAVYSLPSKMPMFLGKKGTVNIEFILHIVNFFKYHMTCETENTLYPLLRDLSKGEEPNFWEGPIQNHAVPKMPGLQWRGSYSYIPEASNIATIRSRSEMAVVRDDPIPDAIDYDEGFQTLVLDPVPKYLRWPSVFEDHLQAIPPAPVLSEVKTQASQQPAVSRQSSRGSHKDRQVYAGLTRDNLLPENPTSNTSKAKTSSARARATSPAKLGKDYVVFTGTGRDLSPFQCSGVVHNLPPQSGIPGWQRLCMMKYANNTTSASSSQSSTPTGSSTSSPSSAYSNSPKSSISSLSSATSGGVHDGQSANPFAWNGGADAHVPDYVDDNCWCYEGIVIPGGKIILGRWWHPLEEQDDQQAVGPFIFWNTDA